MGLLKKLFGMEKIGLALGGGAVLGAAHVGALKALEEEGIKIDYIAGTSIGAFIGALYAFGKSADEIKEISKEWKWLDLARISIGGAGLLTAERMGKLIDDTLGKQNIEDAKIPLAMIATDASNGDKVILTKGDLATAVRASTCIPGIFVPVEIDGRLLIDGGVVENNPIVTARAMGADKVIGIDLNAMHKFRRPKTIFDVLLNSFHISMKAAAKFQHEKADFALTPDLSEFNRSDMNQVPALIEKGYSETKKALSDIRI
jgi:NTE family protein